MTTPGPGPRRQTYFFLNYAHSVRFAADDRPDIDYWVNQVFADLSERIRGATGAAYPEIGFYDGMVPPGADLKTALTDAVSTAHVLVPLYSPKYFSNAWALGERASFNARLARLGRVEASRHIAPVLWTPIPAWEARPEVDAALKLAGSPPEYAENGLRALCMLSAYREQYTQVLGRLVEHIVEVAEQNPLPASPAPPLANVEPQSRSGVALAISVLSPVGPAAPRHRPHGTYGLESTAWRPFVHDQALPIIEHVETTAARLGLSTRVVGVGELPEVARHSPTVLLLDPWFMAGPGQDEQLTALVGRLPRWVTPLVITDEADQQAERGKSLAGRIGSILRDAGLDPPKSVGTVSEFAQVLPRLVAEARKQYLQQVALYSAEPEEDR